jgi:hypothetical protein
MKREDRDSDDYFVGGINPPGRLSSHSDNLLDNLDDFPQSFNDPMKEEILGGMNEDQIDMEYDGLGILQGQTDNQLDLGADDSYGFDNRYEKDLKVSMPSFCLFFGNELEPLL